MLLIFILVLTVSWYLYKKYTLKYWQKRGFPTLGNTNIFFGDCGAALTCRKSFFEVYGDAHSDFKQRGHKIGGIYLMQQPMLIVTDNALAKKMLLTDFDAFADRGISVDPINNPLSVHLFNLDGEAWQKIRKKLSPTFTSGKMKVMFPIVEKHIDVLIKVTGNLCGNGLVDIDYAEWLDKTGVDIIGHIAFGLDCNTLEGANQEFFEMTHRIMRPKLWKTIKMLLCGLTNPANIVTLISSDKEISDFFIKLVSDTVHRRQREKIVANDFLQLLIELIETETKDTGSGLTMMQATAQAFLFFVAGFETTSRTVNYAMLALAQHQDIQDRLRMSFQQELNKNRGIYTYDFIMNNEYLDMVLKETLRLFPPVMALNRMSTKDYRLEDMDLVIPKGIPVLFSSFGIHHDPDNFVKPLEFDPERFSKANIGLVKPCTNLPFGDGPRICIGKMFGYLQSKMMLAKILMHFQLILSDKTDYPFKVSPITTTLMLTSKNPIYFKFKPL